MATATKFEFGNIPKFDGSNFQLWKFSIQILLKAEKLLSVVDGTDCEPVDKNTTEWATWDTRNSRAQVLLLATITQNQIQYLINCENAAKMWARLMSIHEQKTEISKELLWQRFYEYRMSENAKIAEHISAIELLVKQLKDVNENISNSAICSKVINSLPPRFNSFRTAWDSVSHEQQTFENLTARLLKEETRMMSDNSETSHLALEVKTLQSKLEATRLKKKKGHWARECKKRIEDLEKNKGGPKSDSSAYICDISSLYSASINVEENEWICDSGASVHMTSERKWFTELKPIDKPIYVKIANDKMIAATGTGTIEIQAFVDRKWHDRVMYDVLYIPELSRSLFSVGVMTDKNFTHHSYKNRCEFRDRDGKVSCVGTRNNNFWVMNFRVKTPPECNISSKSSMKLWHDRLGHINCNTIKKTVDKNMVKNLHIDNKEEFFCEPCQLGKQISDESTETDQDNVEDDEDFEFDGDAGNNENVEPKQLRDRNQISLGPPCIYLSQCSPRGVFYILFLLFQGKVVIRPIAFKPAAMTPSARFGITGERYGSTPILTRPGSRLTLYGSSNDLHQQNVTLNNYSLDRKLRSSCPSASSSPPLAMSSLSSLPHSHKLINYDSLESVRKSPISNTDHSIINKNPYRLISASTGGSLMDLTPSPSDSGVSELEAALRDRDSELAYLRQTMEHNEQVIFRVYQEKEKVWERELKDLNIGADAHDADVPAAAGQEAALWRDTTSQFAERTAEAGGGCFEEQAGGDGMGTLPKDWGDVVAQDSVEECQNDQTNKCQELLQVRTDHRELREQLEEKDKEIEELRISNSSKDDAIANLKEEIKSSIEKNYEDISETERLRAEVRELREELSDMSLNDYSGVEPGRAQRGQLITHEDSIEDIEIQKLNGEFTEEKIYTSTEVEKLRTDLEIKTKQFENERRTWAQEKEKVLRYQRHLQMNYVQMFRRTRVLEQEIESLTIELELDKTGVKKKLDLSQTIEL
ncbi:hypothetical protein NQ314_011623 [Rhamnusium bicolor]|uniref:GAG-pre-integrase domain-containing protein n=1 Tax=Rhamnusium bicolor TaxID=1586634 RepID=A0AAV8XHL6_9CUCU|nr:hypothetical protein NQ314_011623 [Rhamnusium bicolor]